MSQKQTDEPLIYAIYRPSREFPRTYVVRRWRLRPAVGAGVITQLIDTALPLVVAPTLEDARSVLPPGLTRFDRSPEDDPAIAESWI
jgi:hypothetical protein